MEPSTNSIITCITEALRHQIAPDCRSPRSREQLGTIEALLGTLSLRTGHVSLFIRDYRCKRALIEDGTRLLAECARTSRSITLPQTLTDAALETLQTWEELQEPQREARQTLCVLVAAVSQAVARCRDNEALARLHTWLRSVVQNECAMPQLTVANDRNDNPAEVSSSVAEYFSSKLSIHLTSGNFKCSTLGGGYSRCTLLITLEEEPGQSKEVVVRQKVDDGLLEGVGLSIRDEYLIIQLISSSAVPIPRVLWHETDSSVLGTEFFVSERANGISMGSNFNASQLAPEMARNIAATLGQLHSIDWQAHSEECTLAFGNSITALTTIEIAFDRTLSRWESLIHRAHIRPSPALVASIEWLRNNLPNRDSRPVLLHGDFGLHNMLFDERKLSALLDWELADLGDPARDLILIRPHIEACVPWSAFLRWYVDAGGTEISASTLHYYEMYLSVIGVSCELSALESISKRGSAAAFEYLKLGYVVLPHFYRQLNGMSNKAFPLVPQTKE